MTTRQIDTQDTEQQADDAYNEYVALGDGRTLAALHKHLKKKWGRRAPDLATLEAWSAEQSWPLKTRVHEEAEFDVWRRRMTIQNTRTALERLNQRMVLTGTFWENVRISLLMTEFVPGAYGSIEDENGEPRSRELPVDLWNCGPEKVEAIAQFFKTLAEIERADIGMALAALEALRVEDRARNEDLDDLDLKYEEELEGLMAKLEELEQTQYDVVDGEATVLDAEYSVGPTGEEA